MPEQQGTMTDRLINVIQIILLTQQTGTMAALRHTGDEYERGSIRFIKGEIASAHVGKYSGTEAVKNLQSWGVCHYWFSHQSEAEIVTIIQNEPGREARSAPSTISGTSEPKTPLWQNKTQTTAIPPTVYPQNRPITEPIQPVYIDPNTGKTAITEPIPPVLPTRIQTQQSGDILPPLFTQRIQTPDIDFEQKPFPSNNSKDVAATIPHRMAHNGDVVVFMEQMGFSRLHRHVYLLINGRRTMQDLTQVTGRSIGEVQALIKDLMQLGLVEF